jgi:LEA14-like dessication related protein
MFMIKKQWLLIGIILILFSVIIIFAAVSLTGISTPTVLVKIDAVQLTEDNVSLNISMQLENKNSYALILEDMKVEVRNIKNDIIGVLSFSTEKIPAHEKISLYTIGTFGFNNLPLEEFESYITGSFGVNFFGPFSLSLPLNITIITNPTPIIDTVLLPTISFNTEIEEITETGVKLNGTIFVHNQNEFSMSLSNLVIDLEHSNTEINSDISVTDTVISPHSKVPILFSAFIGYETFEEGSLSSVLSGDVEIRASGISLNRSFSATAEVSIPDLASFIMDNEHVIISLSADFDASITGLNMNVGFRFYNPTLIPLIASELQILVYRMDNETKTLIAEDSLLHCELPSKEETCLQTTFKLPIISFLPILGDGIPDWFLLSITGDIIIANSNQKIPVQMNAYLSGTVFKSNPAELTMSP